MLDEHHETHRITPRLENGFRRVVEQARAISTYPPKNQRCSDLPSTRSTRQLTSGPRPFASTMAPIACRGCLSVALYETVDNNAMNSKDRLVIPLATGAALERKLSFTASDNFSDVDRLVSLEKTARTSMLCAAKRGEHPIQKPVQGIERYRTGSSGFRVGFPGGLPRYNPPFAVSTNVPVLRKCSTTAAGPADPMQQRSSHRVPTRNHIPGRRYHSRPRDGPTRVQTRALSLASPTCEQLTRRPEPAGSNLRSPASAAYLLCRAACFGSAALPWQASLRARE